MLCTIHRLAKSIRNISKNFLSLHFKGFLQTIVFFSLGLTWPSIQNKETRIVSLLLLLQAITSARIELLRQLFSIWVFAKRPTTQTEWHLSRLCFGIFGALQLLNWLSVLNFLFWTFCFKLSVSGPRRCGDGWPSGTSSSSSPTSSSLLRLSWGQKEYIFNELKLYLLKKHCKYENFYRFLAHQNNQCRDGDCPYEENKMAFIGYSSVFV